MAMGHKGVIDLEGDYLHRALEKDVVSVRSEKCANTRLQNKTCEPLQLLGNNLYQVNWRQNELTDVSLINSLVPMENDFSWPTQRKEKMWV